MPARNAISRVVMIYRPENLEPAMIAFKNALGVADFEGPHELADIGVRVFVSWGTGLELIAPFPGGRMTDAMWRVLEERGEGMFNLVYRVPNLDVAERRAASHGFARAGERLNCLDVVESWRDRFRLAMEAPLTPIAGVAVTLIQIEPTAR